MTNTTRYTVGNIYRLWLVSGGSEPVEYLGKNRRGMFRFKFGTGEIWTGYTAPVTE